MVEKQAIARVLRLGQTRNVKVMRYIVKGTVEEVSSNHKLRMFTDVTNSGNAISASEEIGLCKAWMEGRRIALSRLKE
jgi:SNF2 family DNA or RNA helicase